MRCINFLIVRYIALYVGIPLFLSEPSVNDIKTSFSQLLRSTPQVKVQNHRSLCMSFICLIYHGNVTDHDDTIVRRVVRPGVTAVHLRLHPARAPESSVEKKMSTVFVFVMKTGGRKYHELDGFTPLE